VENLATFVDFPESLLGDVDHIGSQSLSVLDKRFLDQLDHIVGATANSRQRAEQLGVLLEGEVPVEALVDKFLLNDFPELVVLEVHTSSTFDGGVKSGNSLSIESLHLLLDKGHNSVPKVRGLLKFVHGDEPESLHNLLVSHQLSVLLVDVSNVRGVLCVHEGEVDLVVVEGEVVVEVSVTALVDHALAHGQHHTVLSLDSHVEGSCVD